MHSIPRSERESIRESYYALKPNIAKYETIQDITVIWLDSRLNVSLDCFDTQIRLRRMIDHLLSFNSSDSFLEYFNSQLEGERIFFIVSGNDGELIIPQIHSTSKPLSIYVFCNDASKHEQWAHALGKIRGVFNTKDALFDKLVKDIKLSMSHLLPIKILGKNDIIQKSIYDLTVEGARSMWFQLLIEAVVKMKHSDDAKADFLEICRKQYENNEVATKMIDEFEQTYTPEKAIWWYTADSFLYRLLNKALRIENIDVIYRFRWFIYELDHQIRELHKIQVSAMKPIETLYRGQKVPATEFKNLQENKGGYITINTFLSVSKSSSVASLFSGRGEERPELESVIFEIEANAAVLSGAYIKDLTNFKEEEEILLPIGSVFRIVDIEDYDDFWSVKLILNKNDNKKMEELFEYLKEDLYDDCPSLSLATILFQMSDYDRAEQYCNKADTELPSNHTNRFDLYVLLGDIYRNGIGDYERAKQYSDLALSHSNTPLQSITFHNQVGVLQFDMGRYDAALEILKEAEMLCQKNDSSSGNIQLTLASIYINQGIVYRHKLSFVQALQNYSKALDISLKNRPKLHPSLAVLYNNIGYLNCILRENDAALTAYENALKIQRQALPERHTDIATVYNNLGNVHLVMEQYSKALECFDKAKNMFNQLLEEGHPKISTLYHNIGDAYHLSNQSDKAVSYLEKALELRIQKLPSTHMHIAESYESLGWVYYKLLQDKKALESCQKSLKIQPNCANIYFCMGNVYNSRCSYDDALFALHKAIELFEKFPAKRSESIVMIHVTVAEIYVAQEKDDDAIRHYEKAVEICCREKITNPKVLMKMYMARGGFFCQKKRYNEALNDLQIALNLTKNSEKDLLYPRILTEMGRLHITQQHFEEALKYLQDAEKAGMELSIEQSSTNCERLSLLAGIFHQQNNYDVALEMYENVLAILSKHPSLNRKCIGRTHIHLGYIYEQKCLYDKSLNAFQEALYVLEKILQNTHSTIAHIHYRIAVVLKKHGNHDVILNAFKKALHYQLHSKSINYSYVADIYDNLDCLMLEQEIEPTTDYFQQSLEIRLKHNPNDVYFSYVNMGAFRIRQDKYLDAEKLLQCAIELFSPNSDLAADCSLGKLYVDLAFVYNYLEQYDKAMEAISIANQLKLSDDRKLDCLIAFVSGIVYHKKKQCDEALKYYEEVLLKAQFLDDDKIPAAICENASNIYYDRKQYKLAVKYYEKCLYYECEIIPLKDVYNQLAQCYVFLGQEEESLMVEYYQKAIDNFMKILPLSLSDPDDLCVIHHSIAKLYFKLNDIDLAIKYYEILRDDLLKLSPKNHYKLLDAYKTLVACYKHNDNKLKMIENYQHRLDVYLNEDYPLIAEDLKMITVICSNISVLFYEIRNFEKAIEYAKKELNYELQIMESISVFDDDIMYSIACIYLNLSTLYEETGDIENHIGTLKILLNSYKKFVPIANSPRTYLTVALVCENLSEYYEKTGDFSLAFNYYDEAFDFRKKSGTMNEEKFNECQEHLNKLKKINGIEG